MSPSEAIGALGVALLLLAFALSSFGRWSPHAVPYHATNLVGASLSCVASAMIPFWPFVVLEGCWGLVALVALVQALRRKG